jgi:hypothetical protein
MKYILVFLLCFSSFTIFAQEKSPAPGADEIKETLSAVREIYAADYKSATSTEKKDELAEKMAREAIETKDDPVAKFVVLKEAQKLAVEIVNPELALLIDEELARGYQLDLLELKVATLGSLHSKSKFSAQSKKTTESARELLTELMAAEKYEMAEKALSILVRAAGKTRDAKLVRSIREIDKQTKIIFIANKRLISAMDVIATSPMDPEANLTAGKINCFVMNDWSKGLPMLALGSDDALKEVAALDLENPTTPQDQTKVGDLWYKVAEALKESNEQTAIQRRVSYWYTKSLPNLSGLTKIKVTNRLKKLPKFIAKSAGNSKPTFGTRSLADLVGKSPSKPSPLSPKPSDPLPEFIPFQSGSISTYHLVKDMERKRFNHCIV